MAKYKNGESAIGFLVLASLFFYSWWNPAYLALILCSIGINYALGETISKQRKKGNKRSSRIFLIAGVSFNLGLIGYFKYTNFLVDNINNLLGSNIQLEPIVLPLAISFFTFQQIAYLIDAFKGETQEFKLSHYALFVTFFPQLIAGPIVHHKEMLPQFLHLENTRPNLEKIASGIAIFSMGLFKKVVLADGVAQYATPVFDSIDSIENLSFFIAWGGALAYTFQLYFDFSGYSDMAIGLSLMFGISLPINFASPYKSISIIEFWRRWHMTLSRFLRDYVYIALGGNRKGDTRRYINLFTTMLLGGIWHGAGWTFVLWGGLHGVYLIINHAWHFIKRLFNLQWLDNSPAWNLVAWLITFISIVNAWVLFRAKNLADALEIFKGMYGFNGIALPNAIYVRLHFASDLLSGLNITSYIGGGTQFVYTYTWVGILLIIVLVMPNTQQIMKRYFDYSSHTEPHYALFNQGIASQALTFQFNRAWAFVMAGMFVFSIFGLTRVSEFLYFQF
ncbi:MBOAT family protein [Methylomarinum sp. Ch1-1]|uniref:Probable alginate O-acetylase n=1 Tax=Methylomarinum roseum TaxID=3067653 RepID=A0AAU7NPL0_9GAMM|nr:MBOAT family protein [Methylomarinum sp. Ch1-1]MDP4521211.1 MBOAT family protein [Methylomarinum sp. Ch1-1]